MNAIWREPIFFRKVKDPGKRVSSTSDTRPGNDVASGAVENYTALVATHFARDLVTVLVTGFHQVAKRHRGGQFLHV